MAATVVIGAAILWILGYVDSRFAMAFLAGGILVGGIGWIDDHRSVPPAVRALIHATAAAMLLTAFDWPASIRIGAVELSFGIFGCAVYLLLTMWLINLFNFMDGIDGIAASQALLVSASGSALLLVDADVGIALLGVIIAGASAGFLQWNWPPARIFMGDVGSGFLGFALASMMISSEQRGSISLLVWIILLSVFIFDASVTLIRRVARGERWYDAHRSHAYQRLVLAGRSHLFVTIGSILLTGMAALLGAAVTQREGLLLPMLVAQVVFLTVVYWKIEHIYPMQHEHRP